MADKAVERGVAGEKGRQALAVEQSKRGVEIDRIALLESLADRLDAALALFDSQGLPAFLARYAALDGLVGHALTLRLPDRELAGTATGIDHTGCLVLTLPDGSTQSFAVGEVERVLD